MKTLALKIIEDIPVKEYFAEEFLQGMLDRMGMSFYKYGSGIENTYPESYDAIKNMKARMKLYKETGNKEHLMDAANFLMIEFMYPKHKKAHFRATDSHESPGLIP